MAHKHSVYDSDTHFSINPLTRALKNESSTKNSVIQHDHNSERVTFEIPRYFEDHDMSQCNVVQVHYINIDSQTGEKNVGIYTVDDLQVFPDDEKTVVLSWLISHNATKLVGPLHFLLRFSCVADDNTIDYAWNTAVYSGFTVASGIYNSEQIEETYADVLEQWRKDIVNGKTAYEYAQDGGYTGTETEFAAKLAQEYTQPDLNLPENVLGGIKNRTHYKEGGLTVIVPEGKPWTPEDAESDDEFYLTHTAPLQAGEKYVVHIDGEEFTCIGQDLSAMQPGFVGIGDCSIWGIPGITGNGEPFLIAYIPAMAGQDAMMGYMNLTGSTELPTVSVCHDGVTVHKLPNEYLDMEWIPKGKEVLVAETDRAGDYRQPWLTASMVNEGETLIVYVNGVRYELTVQGPSDLVHFPNEKYLIGDLEHGDPVGLHIEEEGTTTWGGPLGFLHIRICRPAPNRIPRKFLPEDMYGTEGGLVEVLPETTITVPAGDFGGVESALPLVDGQTYIVTWNGVEYTTTAMYDNSDGEIYYLGDVYTMTGGMIGTNPTGEPFFIGVILAGGYTMMTPIPPSETEDVTVTLSILHNSETIRKIDNKYLDLGWLPKLNRGKTTVFDETIHLSTLPRYTLTKPLCKVVDGETYWVTWNGVEYECTGHVQNGVNIRNFNRPVTVSWVGNAALTSTLAEPRYGTDTGEPFLYEAIHIGDQYVFLYIFGNQGDTDVQMKFVVPAYVPNKMPQEYLPESVDELIVNSSTADSTKKFRITVDDTGTITATEVT